MKSFLRFTHHSGFGSEFREQCGLETARKIVSASFPAAVEFDSGDSVWFYRDQNSFDQDANNMDNGAGVVAVWESVKP